MLRILTVFFAYLLLLFSADTNSSPWVGAQDKQLHYDLQTLAEWGYLDSSVTTFPIPWKGVAKQIEALQNQDMSVMPAQALARLKHYLKTEQRGNSRQFLILQMASDDVRFRSLDDGVEESAKLSLTKTFYHKRWSGQITANYASGGRQNLDNSFIAYQFGDWNLRLGSIDQFWGPAQSSSLILSNNTRPLPSLAFSRSVTTKSESPYLAWLGPWYFTTQLAQMDDERVVPDQKLLLTRFTARPFKSLELGASWSAKWGGEGRDESFDSFIDLITFQNTCQLPAGCTDPDYSAMGNHIAGFDFTYTFRLLERPVSLYGQRIEEDAQADYSIDDHPITDNANLLGLSTYIHNAKVFIEASDSVVSCAGRQSDTSDCFYEHDTYRKGYRMYGRPIGSTFDSDAKQITLGANIRFVDGAVAELYLRAVELHNEARSSLPALTENPSEDVLELSGFYQRPYGDWLLKAGGSIANRKFESLDSNTESLLYLKAQYAF